MQDWELKPAKDLHLPPLERWRTYQRETGLIANLARAGWWSFLKTTLRLWHRWEVHGAEHLPAVPNFVLVANHASHLDALVLGAALPLSLRDHLYPLAAGDVFFEVPAMAAFSATVLNALPVWRKNAGSARAIKDLRKRLEEDPTIYILFPEGTRSRSGQLSAFKAGIGMLMAGTPVPVVPCHLEGTFAAYPPAAKLPRPSKIRVRIGKPRLFQDTINRRAGWDQIAQVLRSDICALGGISDTEAQPAAKETE